MKKYLVPTILISLWIITSIAVWYLKENKLLTIIEGQKVYDRIGFFIPKPIAFVGRL